MTREEEIQQRSKKIQYQINKLKKLNCSLDLADGVFGIFDNSIAPEMHEEYIREVVSYQPQVVFSFNTSG